MNMINDNWIEILNHVDLEILRQLILVSHRLLTIIKSLPFLHLKIYVGSEKILKYIIANYHFKNLMLNKYINVNPYVDYLSTCYRLDLSCSCSKITKL
jgi:hypothetical protein